MGEDVTATVFSREDRQRYRDKVKRNLDVFARMLRESRFDDDNRSIGLEIELNLTDEARRPRDGERAGARAHRRPDAFVTELGQFNVEINIPPRLLQGEVFSELEQQVRDSLNAAEDKARETGRAHDDRRGSCRRSSSEHLHARSLSANPRYKLLNEQIFAARGEDLEISINGVERLSDYADSIAPEAACTSVQLHQLVHPEAFAQPLERRPGDRRRSRSRSARTRRSSSARSCGGRRGSRCSSRRPTRGPRSSRRRACARACGSASAGSRRSSTCSRRTSATSPRCSRCVDAEDPVEVLERGDIPALGELKLHNGTVYRWNRPVYEVVRGRPHVRVENRVLPAGPTVVDILANAAFYYGLVRQLVEDERPIWSQMSFSAAEDNLHAGARDGLDARVYWPGVGDVPVTELVLRRLLPLAHEGLERYGVDPHARDRLLGIIERRCVRGGQRRDVAAAHVPPALRGARARPRRGAAADDRAATATTCTRTSRCTRGPLASGR